jgi:hypothetical protein
MLGSGLIARGPMGGVQGRKVFAEVGADWIPTAPRPPGRSRLVTVNGRPAVIGEMNQYGGASRFITFWDGREVVVISFDGAAKGAPPSDEALLEVAGSMVSR